MHLLIDKSATLGKLFALVLERLDDHPLFENAKRIFCTLDEAGLVSPGRMTDRAGEKLRDGQLLFLHYGFFVRRGTSGPGFWRKVVLKRPTKGQPCHRCCCSTVGSTITVISGFHSLLLCSTCFEQSRLHSPTCPRSPACHCFSDKTRVEESTYLCINCGANGAGLQFDPNANAYMAVCLGRCRSEPVNRICHRCEIPTDQTLNCGGCRKVRYCSVACQRVDWKRGHKVDCRPTAGGVGGAIQKEI